MAPTASDERVVRLLEGIQAQLSGQRPTPPTAKARLPFWLVLAIGLLLFCQALQFGLLVAIFMSGMGSPISQLDWSTPTADLQADGPEPSPFPQAAPVDDGLASAEPTIDDRGGEEFDLVDEEPLGEEPGTDLEPEPEGDAPMESPGSTARVVPTADIPDRTEPEDKSTTGSSSSSSPQASSGSSTSSSSSGSSSSPTSTNPQTSSSSPSAGSTKTSPSSSSASSSAEPKTSTSSSSTSSTSSSTPSSSTASAASGSSSIQVISAEGYVVGPGGRRPCGALPAGTYEVFAQPNDGAGYFSLGVHALTEGQEMSFRCGFGACKRLQ